MGRRLQNMSFFWRTGLRRVQHRVVLCRLYRSKSPPHEPNFQWWPGSESSTNYRALTLNGHSGQEFNLLANQRGRVSIVIYLAPKMNDMPSHPSEMYAAIYKIQQLMLLGIDSSRCWCELLLLKHVKTIINQPFGNGLYHLFMVDDGIVYPHYRGYSCLFGDWAQGSAGKSNSGVVVCRQAPTTGFQGPAWLLRVVWSMGLMFDQLYENISTQLLCNRNIRKGGCDQANSYLKETSTSWIDQTDPCVFSGQAPTVGSFSLRIVETQRAMEPSPVWVYRDLVLISGFVVFLTAHVCKMIRNMVEFPALNISEQPISLFGKLSVAMVLEYLF